MDHPRRRLATIFVAGSILVTGCSSTPPDSAQPQPAPPSPSQSQSSSQSGTGATADGAGDPYYPQDGNGGYDVVDYDVSISYDPATEILDGDTTVSAKATAELAKFPLDLVGFEVAGVDVDGKPAKVGREGEHELVITPQTPVAKDAAFKTRVRYKG